ncbi:nucleotidyltransferase domain-containing protein [Synechococcus sp. ATX 2A4]|uniref:nucleotidyltransferase domain-containing protein n=1 Tax=Synechococcus sp. ATX 2A4 TaxID=2823727 RepID=UPI0020CD53F6|nr:nucleotidyltransferase domain-containing protein [Synechococcus sp. ATX 2A4]
MLAIGLARRWMEGAEDDVLTGSAQFWFGLATWLPLQLPGLPPQGLAEPGQNGPMAQAFTTSTPTTTTPAASIEDRLAVMAREIQAVIPGAEVRLFGSWARGTARPDSDIDLLITVTDDWLASHDRYRMLDRLRWRLSGPVQPVDLLLYSRSQVSRSINLHSHVISHAYREGRLLGG